MAFQQPTSEDSPANAHYLIPFGGIAGSPTASFYTDRDHQVLEPASPLSDIDLLLAGEIFPVRERCLSSPAYLREASSGGDLNRSVILLPSSREYDASHPNLDAHSAPPRTDLVERESFLFGPNVCKVQLRIREFLSRLQASAGTVDPVTMENCCANSAVTKISISGLHQNATHISILGMEFNISVHSLQQILAQVKSIKLFTQSQPIETIDCTWNPATRKFMAVFMEFLSHVKIFYSRTPYVEFWVELCNVEVIPSIACDIPHPAFSIRPQQSFMTALCDNSYHLPNVSVATESPDMNATLDDGSTSDSDSMIETSEVACEDGYLRIQLDSALLYSVIKEGLIGAPYPEAFKATQTVNDCEFSIFLKIFPFKSKSEHVSVWAEVTAPPHTRGQVTLQVTAFDPRPQKEQRLGRMVERTENLKYSDAGDCKKAHFTLDEVMLHMFAFYLIHGIELCVSISYHY